MGDARGDGAHAAGDAPFYLPQRDECALFERCHAQRLAVLLKGPTGCGKTRFVEHMAWRLGRPLVTVACHDDLAASDLVGRYLVHHDRTAWHDGPLARAVREGAICYLDEVVEARQDTVVVLHALTDHRRILPIDKTGEQLAAPPGFMLVLSYNPGYQRMVKDLKPSTRQRFVALEFDFPAPAQEARVVQRESGCAEGDAVALVQLAQRLRQLQAQGLTELPGTRLLVAAARLVAAGTDLRTACRVALLAPLSDDPVLLQAMQELVEASFA
ncbi:CbbQ/NirQ/NorQ/GpvN family protein [uncultured Azohydromonas sp.]|jgi:MoxR-like ATPases|uniref:CbbQ/NirQ/NorQ/GpvN family protein n=1 Tax=uncultured Azohydromonas sp. TaxID=487342 RepID=UPI00262F60EF|nr:CbbQ/NirQ/NorQ/GpvN family protein [uncultured Azohydromonas sp.]